MRTKKKMKDFEAQSKEWWEVTKDYFAKDLKKNLVQYKSDERILKYKLKIVKRIFKILSMVVQ
jgi:hypothetical protein